VLIFYASIYKTLQSDKGCIEFDVLTEVIIKTAFFRDVTKMPNVLDEYIASICEAEELTQQEISLPPACVCFLLGLLLYTEEGNDIFLQNAGLSLNYTALQPIRLYSY
jgi:hypothetical protein